MNARRAAAACVVLLLGLALAPHVAQGQSLQNAILRNSFEPVGAGARATGMGGAFIAVADDGTAASFNPAGLAQLRRTEVAFVSFSDGLTSSFEQATGIDIGLPPTTKERSNVPEFAGVALPFEVGARHLTFQLSYQRAVDLRGEGLASLLSLEGSFTEPVYPGPFDREHVVDLRSSQSGGLHTISLSAGYELTDHLSIGASVNSWLGSWRAEGGETGKTVLKGGSWSVTQEDLRAVFVQEHGLRGLNLNVGALLHHSWISFGGVMRLPFAAIYHFDEHEVETTADETGAMSDAIARDYAMRGSLRWPRSGGLGLALRPARGLTLAADFSFAEWSRATIENVPNGALLTDEVVDATGQPLPQLLMDRNFFDLNPEPQTLTRDTSQWRFGAEYLLTPRRVVIPLRVGFFIEQSPLPDLGTLDSRHLKGVTVGLGLNFRRVAFDLAAETRSGRTSIGVVRGEQGPMASSGVFPTEKLQVQRLIGSVILRLGGTGDNGLKRLLRTLFAGKKR